MTDNYTDEQIEGLLENITQGEWIKVGDLPVINAPDSTSKNQRVFRIVDCTPDGFANYRNHDKKFKDQKNNDAKFIAASPTIIRQLLTEKRELSKERDYVRRMHSQLATTMQAKLDGAVTALEAIAEDGKGYEQAWAAQVLKEIKGNEQC